MSRSISTFGPDKPDKMHKALMSGLLDHHTRRGFAARRVAMRYREVFGVSILDSGKGAP